MVNARVMARGGSARRTPPRFGGKRESGRWLKIKFVAVIVDIGWGDIIHSVQ